MWVFRQVLSMDKEIPNLASPKPKVVKQKGILVSIRTG